MSPDYPCIMLKWFEMFVRNYWMKGPVDLMIDGDGGAGVEGGEDSQGADQQDEGDEEE
jgi:hypothetical protein